MWIIYTFIVFRHSINLDCSLLSKCVFICSSPKLDIYIFFVFRTTTDISKKAEKRVIYHTSNSQYIDNRMHKVSPKIFNALNVNVVHARVSVVHVSNL